MKLLDGNKCGAIQDETSFVAKKSIIAKHLVPVIWDSQLYIVYIMTPISYSSLP